MGTAKYQRDRIATEARKLRKSGIEWRDSGRLGPDEAEAMSLAIQCLDNALRLAEDPMREKDLITIVNDASRLYQEAVWHHVAPRTPAQQLNWLIHSLTYCMTMARTGGHEEERGLADRLSTALVLLVTDIQPHLSANSLSDKEAKRLMAAHSGIVTLMNEFLAGRSRLEPGARLPATMKLQ